jgi:hypothetical protein
VVELMILYTQDKNSNHLPAKGKGWQLFAKDQINRQLKMVLFLSTNLTVLFGYFSGYA